MPAVTSRTLELRHEDKGADCLGGGRPVHDRQEELGSVLLSLVIEVGGEEAWDQWCVQGWSAGSVEGDRQGEIEVPFWWHRSWVGARLGENVETTQSVVRCQGGNTEQFTQAQADRSGTEEPLKQRANKA